MIKVYTTYLGHPPHLIDTLTIKIPPPCHSCQSLRFLRCASLLQPPVCSNPQVNPQWWDFQKNQFSILKSLILDSSLMGRVSLPNPFLSVSHPKAITLISNPYSNIDETKHVHCAMRPVIKFSNLLKI